MNNAGIELSFGLDEPIIDRDVFDKWLMDFAVACYIVNAIRLDAR